MKTGKNSIVKMSFKEAHKRFVILSLPLSFFAILTIGILVLGFFAPFSLILTIPFIVIPSFFSLSAINTIATNPNAHESIGFFVMFRAYFSQIFRGGYRVIVGLLKALLAFIVISIILSAILTATILNKDPEYLAFIDEINNLTDANLIIEAVDKFIANNEAFNKVMLITNSVSSFAAFYLFLHHFSVNSIKINYNFLAKLPLPMVDLNLIFKSVMKKTRASFYKKYYQSFWFLGLIFIIGFSAGALISIFFIPNLDMVQVCVIGLFGAFISLLFFIPYYLNASQLLFLEFKTLYIDTLIDLSKQSLEELKKVQSISEDKEKEILQAIESQKEHEEKSNDNDDTTK